VNQPISTAIEGRSSRRSTAIFVAVAAVGALGSLGLGRIIWPDPPGMSPPSNLLPLFIVISVIESLSFGVGLSFLLYGWPRLRQAGRDRRLTFATYLSIAWLMMSWWPHDNLHRVLAHGDWSGLLRIEYGFHVTLVAAGAIVAVFFVRRYDGAA
jgi:hypothetical protein